MLKFSVNSKFFYGHLPLLERFAAAARDGVKAIELFSPFDCEPEAVRKAADANSLVITQFNGAFGDWDAGERGLASKEEREADYKKALDNVVRYARALDVHRINLMAGTVNPGEAWETLAERLVKRFLYAADLFAANDIILQLEHINPYDMPGYCVDTPAKALEIVARVNRPNVKIQYDFYHAQRTSGELVKFMRDNFKHIAHVQVADNPGRNQPGTGEINYAFVLAELDKLGYDGWVGLEYVPKPDAAGSLGWMAEMGYSL